MYNVGFYLDELAKLWYGNNSPGITTRSAFRTCFAGRPAARKLRAEQRLRVRSHKAGETFTSYIEDVIDLCKRVDPSVREADKIKHILKGVDDDAFQMLLTKDPQTISDVVNLCQSFDELRRQRSLTRQACGQAEPLSSLALVREIVEARVDGLEDVFTGWRWGERGPERPDGGRYQARCFGLPLTQA